MNNHNSGYEILEFIILRNFHNFSFKYKKLDQETWLCWTHLDDLKDNMLTILDHIRSYYNLFQFGPFWIFLDHLKPTLTILDIFVEFLAILDNFRQFKKKFQPCWACLDLF